MLTEAGLVPEAPQHMYIHKCMRIYIYIPICIYNIYIYIYTHVFTCTYIFSYTYTYMYAYVYFCVYIPRGLGPASIQKAAPSSMGPTADALPGDWT